MIPRRVWIAVFIAFLCHGLFILTARYRLSYDAYTHMLFANHYAENWFSLWEPRWYAGFTVVSYPPLTHQLIALLIPLFGFDAAFAIILWVVATLYPLGIYSFSRIFTGKTAASYASLASAVLLPIYVTAYIFGQLPFLTSTLIALFGAASLARYLRQGRLHDLVLAVLLAATTMAAHHATLIVQPFFIIAVIVSQLNQKHWRVIFFRLSIFCVAAIVAGWIVIWPFWQWGTGQTMQTPIDHLSRHNFFSDPLALAIFFFPLYGPLAFFIPFVFRTWPVRFWGLLGSFVVLFLLGLGGTTPLPRLFFGENWAWLTYDRFAFWACLTLTPFFGTLLIQWRYKWRRGFIARPIPVALGRVFPSAFTFFAFAGTALAAWFAPFIFPTQPPRVDMRPIVDFLNQQDRSAWRYLTFGFGNQFAYLNLLTTATTIDGSYNTVRTIPELRSSGLAEVDTVYWTQKGIPSIEPILKISGEYGVRWGFVNRQDFIPELKKDGWKYVRTLSNGVQVWDNPNARLPERSDPPQSAPFTSFSWGIFPMLSLIAASALGRLRVWPVQGERIIRGVYAGLVGLLPVGLCFWYYRTMAAYPQNRVYFIYTDALFFLSDALALFSIILWLSVRIANPIRSAVLDHDRPGWNAAFCILFFSLCVLATLSTLWSSNWQTSLHISLHVWLIFLLICSLRDWPEAWKPAMYGFCAAVSLHLITGFVGFALQSTAFLEPLQLKWPGVINPSMHGIPVVQLADGPRILRVYGMFPHPNLLGGFVLVSLIGPASLFLSGERLNHPALMLSAFGAAVLALTFSRSAWLGLLAFSLTLILKVRHLTTRRLFLLLAAIGLGFAITLFPYRRLVLSRTVNITSNSEIGSLAGRVWFNQEATQMLRAHPLTGVGMGSFIIQLARDAPEGYPIEPAHNILLLAGSELGVPGILLVVATAVAFTYQLIRTQNANAILAGAVIVGLAVTSLFDHYLWTLAPGRLLLGLMLGLWAGQVSIIKQVT